MDVRNQSNSASSSFFVLSSTSRRVRSKIDSPASAAFRSASASVTRDANRNTRSISTTTASSPRFVHGTFNRSDPMYPASSAIGARSASSAVFFN